jgi:hypothetical protein
MKGTIEMQNTYRKARKDVHIIRRQSIVFIIPLTFILVFILAACGYNGGTSTGSGSTPSPTPTHGVPIASHGCPGGIVPNPPQGKANIVVPYKKSMTTVNASKGDVIEFHMPYGEQWTGPTTSQGVLQLQTPYGYASTTAKACIWRFVAADTGTAQLNFSARAICPKGAMCPMYVLLAHFTVNVQ